MFSCNLKKEKKKISGQKTWQQVVLAMTVKLRVALASGKEDGSGCCVNVGMIPVEVLSSSPSDACTTLFQNEQNPPLGGSAN